MIYLKEKYAKNMKRKKNQNAFSMVASVFLGDVGGYMIYLKGDSPHQTVMIVCECI